MTRDRFLHILCFLHFADNLQIPEEGEEYDQEGEEYDQEGEEYDRLWKLKDCL